MGTIKKLLIAIGIIVVIWFVVGGLGSMGVLK